LAAVVLAVSANVVGSVHGGLSTPRILTLRELPPWKYYGYLLLYNVAYVLDDGLMLTLAVVTLSRRKLQERAGRWLKLVSGSVMLVLGAVLIGRPAWLVW
jgi:threonine/homoserine/homoserine lactone efflux protein